MEHKITVEKTARYFTYGNEKADHIWIVLHGYAQLPEYFIRKFQGLDPEKNFVVAPEGLHRFYRRGSSGRVGASWMTKEARLDDIADYIRFLNQLKTELFSKHEYKQRFLVGFSQGGATASRWHHYGSYRANHFILWASVFPEDVPFQEDNAQLFESNNYFVMGDEDEFLSDKKLEIISYFQQLKCDIKIKEFKGRHDIDEEQLLEIAKECQS